MERVRAAARVATNDGELRIEYVDVAIRILHFCFDWGDNDGDLDNIAKPILDAMCLTAIFNDNQAREIVLRRTDLERNQVTQIERATPLLADRLDAALSGRMRVGFVYISVETQIEYGSLP